MLINIINSPQDMVYLLVYTPLLGSLLALFFNSKSNHNLLKIFLPIIMVLHLICYRIGEVHVQRSNIRSFSSNLHISHSTSLLMGIFLGIKMILLLRRFRSHTMDKYVFSLYYLTLFCFTILCLSDSLAVSFMFLFLWGALEYVLWNNGSI